MTAEPAMMQDQETGQYQYMVSLTLSDEGKEKFAEATERLVGRHHLHLEWTT